MAEQKPPSNYKKIGNYKVKCGKTNTKIVIYRVKPEEPEEPYFITNVEFSTRVIRVLSFASHFSRISLQYGTNYFDNIFRELKLREEYIEGLLQRPDISEPWLSSREVLQCIFDLERQVKASSLEDLTKKEE